MQFYYKSGTSTSGGISCSKYELFNFKGTMIRTRVWHCTLGQQTTVPGSNGPNQSQTMGGGGGTLR